jgi:nucleotide-binding universal stress UspA family protein/hemerythrin-like domain-containing protein
VDPYSDPSAPEESTMFKHLLAPLDDTPLSTAHVTSTIDLARSMGARITFFHAHPDWDSSGDGALVRVVDPALFADAAAGSSNAVLLKATAAAKAAGVPCAAVTDSSDHPAEAIVRTAREQGCDLIVMASHGPGSPWKSWTRDSQTERVLQHAPVALLVTRVEAQQPLSDRERALDIIRDEHRSIAVVVSALRDLAKELGDTPPGPADVISIAGMVSYLRGFPEKVHHPKEERHLHRLMRLRDPSCEPLLAEVESQHARERVLLEQISTSLAPGDHCSPALHEAVLRFADHVFAHLKLEESQVLRRARECLGDADWAEVAEAFRENDDGRFGNLDSAELRRVFSRIANAIAARQLLQPA